MRPIALGRKNWLHIGSEEAGTHVAAVVSVMETCVTVRATPSSVRSGWRGEYVHANSGPSVQAILTSDRCNS
jgi:hypothetical protein